MHFVFILINIIKDSNSSSRLLKTTVFSQPHSHLGIPFSQRQSFLPLQLIVQVSLSLNNILILLFLDFSVRHYLFTSHYERRKFSFSSFPGFHHILLLSSSFIFSLINFVILLRFIFGIHIMMMMMYYLQLKPFGKPWLIFLFLNYFLFSLSCFSFV